MAVVCLNGDYVPMEKAFISSQELGFLHGFGLFETILVKDGHPVFLKRHFKRLFTSANILCIPIFFSAAGMARMIEETIHKNEVENGSVRLTLSAGIDVHEVSDQSKTTSYAGINSSGRSTLVIFAQRNLAYTPDHYRHVWRAGFTSSRKNEHSPLVRLKTLNYLENLLAKKEVGSRGWDEAIFLNTAGNLAEGSRSNIFLVKKGRIITPSIDQGLLPGIVRQVVLEKCSSSGIPTEEKVVSPMEIYEAGECFLTNSLIGIMPLVEVNGRLIGNGRPGVITQKLEQEIF